MSPAAHLPGVLVVDDDPHVRTLLDLGLHQEGFAVWLAASGPEALDLYHLHYHLIRVVLLELLLPGALDGPSVLRALQESDPRGPLVCYFLSSSPGSYTLEELRGLGAAGFLAKPFTIDTVVQLLRQHAGTS